MVKLYEMKPNKFSDAHTNKNLAEIVCSNSFKSNLHTNACGLLKEELRYLNSLLIKVADETQVPAGQALAVDREIFAERVTEVIKNHPLIEVIHEEVTSIEELATDGIVIIATGPLTSQKMADEISKITGQDKLYFYDAAAPIISKESIDFNIAPCFIFLRIHIPCIKTISTDKIFYSIPPTITFFCSKSLSFAIESS